MVVEEFVQINLLFLPCRHFHSRFGLPIHQVPRSALLSRTIKCPSHGPKTIKTLGSVHCRSLEVAHAQCLSIVHCWLAVSLPREPAVEMALPQYKSTFFNYQCQIRHGDISPGYQPGKGPSPKHQLSSLKNKSIWNLLSRVEERKG